jgi:hypothetical protein
MSLFETTEEHEEEIDAYAQKIWHAVFINASTLRSDSHETLLADVLTALAPLDRDDAIEALAQFDHYNPGRWSLLDNVIDAAEEAIEGRKTS